MGYGSVTWYTSALGFKKVSNDSEVYILSRKYQNKVHNSKRW